MKETQNMNETHIEIILFKYFPIEVQESMVQ